MKSFHQELTRAREAKQFSDVDAARMGGMSVMEYYDLEAYENEWLEFVPAYALRRLIAFFEVPWRECRVWGSGELISRKEPLAEQITRRRTKLDMSREDMADRAGYSVGFAEVIENHRNGLALWPLEPAFELAAVLGLDEQSLAACVLKA